MVRISQKTGSKIFHFHAVQGGKLHKQGFPPSSATKQPFAGFRGGHGTGYMGLSDITWVPIRAQVTVLSPNDHPNPSQGRQKGFGESQILENFQVPLTSLSSTKTDI